RGVRLECRPAHIIVQSRLDLALALFEQARDSRELFLAIRERSRAAAVEARAQARDYVGSRFATDRLVEPACPHRAAPERAAVSRGGGGPDRAMGERGLVRAGRGIGSPVPARREPSWNCAIPVRTYRRRPAMSALAIRSETNRGASLPESAVILFKSP